MAHPLSVLRSAWIAVALAGCPVFSGQAAPVTRLLSEREVVLPMQESTRQGGLVPLGATTVEADPATGVVRAQNPSGLLAFVRWFPNHIPLPVTDVSDPALRLRVVIQGGNASVVQAAWRLAGENSEMGPTIEGQLEPQADGTSAVTLAVPAIPEGRQINAVFLLFPQAQSVEVQRLVVVLPVDILLQAEASTDPWKSAPLRFSGRGATPGAAVRIAIQPAAKAVGTPLELQATANAEGRFETQLDPEKLVPGDYTASASEPKSTKTAPEVKFFVFPVLNAQKQPPVKVDKTNLMVDGKPFAFVGINYSGFLLGFAREPNYREIVRNLVEMRSWGLRVARVPVSFAVIQPEEGVFPDDPRWPDAMRAHNLDPQLIRQLDYFVQVAGQMGIYSILDWHGMPTNPYDYHVGGQPKDQEAGKPGTAVAWLAPSAREPVAFDPSNRRHRQALLTTHTWLAGHFKGNTNVLCIEIPYNEPHETFMAVEANWRELTDLAAQAVRAGDPDRLTFTMASAYGHDNLSPSATWLPPDRASGGGPHFYLANGPVNARPDARQFKQPYLARDATATFGHAQASVFLPYSATNYPLYNGEAGEYGNEDFLPNEKYPDRAEWIIEAQVVQAYAAGWAGVMDWTLWGHPTDFTPYREIYGRVFKRFSPVFAAGPVDRTAAEVAFVQSPGAVPPQNGMNHACVPLAKLALALHLPSVHYYSDAHFLYGFRAGVPTGLEQVEEGVALSRYKALVVDRRNLDTRAAHLAQISRVPVLWTDDAEKITVEELSAFLEKNGVPADTRTPEGLQIVEGPGHLLIYARANQSFDTRAFPHLKRRGNFRLIGEAGKEAFRGDAATLAEKGLAVSLPRWSTAIYRFSE
jgi:hypothetical protein